MDHLINSLTRLSTNNTRTNNPVPGQLFRAKVLQILPEQRVLIKVGQKKMEVNVNQSLIKGSSYLFQVEQANPSVKVKVLSQQTSLPDRMNLGALLEQFGGEQNKENRAWLKAIMDLKAPLHKKDLVQAFNLIKESTHKNLARDVLMQMFNRKMPVRSSIFSALTSKYTTEYSQTLAEVQNQLGDKPLSATDDKIKTMIRTIQGNHTSEGETSFIRKLSVDIANREKTVTDLLKKAGISDGKQSLSTPIRNSQGESVTLTPAGKEHLASSLRGLMQEQISLSSSEKQIISKWLYTSEKFLNQMNVQGALTDDSIVLNSKEKQWQEVLAKLLDSKLLDKISPHIQKSSVEFLAQLDAQANSGRGAESFIKKSDFKALFTDIQRLMGRQVTTEQQQLLVQTLHTLGRTTGESNKDQMWLQLKAMMNGMGFEDEQLLAKAVKGEGERMPVGNSLKSLLLRGLQEGSDIKAETANRLIHLINGTQLAAYADHSQTLQLSLQFPGNFLGALNDVHLNMEGRKKEEGKIDSDYCHMMFYLHLSQLEETIIDLNIVERRVSVVVYNENPHMEKLFKPYISSIEEGLEKAGYQLLSLKGRVTSDVQPEPGPITWKISEEGVDFKI